MYDVFNDSSFLNGLGIPAFLRRCSGLAPGGRIALAPVVLLAAAALLAWLACGALAEADEGAALAAAKRNTRIVGGEEARPGAWPWQVNLSIKLGEGRTSRCGGSVIAPRWVLTAAHCVEGGIKPGDLSVLVGTHDLDKGGQRIAVRAIRMHHNYTGEAWTDGNDIALLQLAEPVGVPAVRLLDAARSKGVATPGTLATVTGWGVMEEGGSVATKLMEVKLPLVETRMCQRAYPDDRIDHSTLCAGFREGGKDSCSGDSGGPLMVRESDDWVQIGVVSWGEGCARPGKYGVYTHVGAFAAWLKAGTGLDLMTVENPPPASEPTTPAVAEAPAPPAAAPPAQASPSSPPGDRALVVGINRYLEPTFPELQGATRDAQNVRSLLSEYLGFGSDQIRLLTDEQATRGNIMAAIRDWLVAGSRPGTRVLLYFAGHGYYQKDVNGDESDGYDEALVPHDARLLSPDGQPMRVSNLILDDDVGRFLAPLRDRQVYVIVDACHAGTMTRSLSLAAVDPRRVRTIGLGIPGRSVSRTVASRNAAVSRQREAGFTDTGNNVVSWAAVSPLQLALEDREGSEPQGVFTSRFVRGIAERRADRNGDGRIVYAELLDYLREESAAYCTRHKRDCEAGLTPLLEGPGDLLLRDVVNGRAVGGGTAAATDVLGHPNAAAVQLAIRPSARLRVGDTVTYRVQSGRTGHLLIIDVAADGSVTQLFPNRFSQDAGQGTLIQAGGVIEIPNAFYGFRLRAAPPLGRGRLFAVVTQDPVSLDDLLGPNRDLSPVPGAAGWLAALGERLRQPWLGEAGTREARWSTVQVDYEIVAGD